MPQLCEKPGDLFLGSNAFYYDDIIARRPIPRYRRTRVLLSIIAILSILMSFACLLPFTPEGSFGCASSILFESPTPTENTPENAPQRTDSADDTVLMIKTGSTVLWQRLPAHLLLVQDKYIPNLLLYSDMATTVSGFEVIDCLANVSSTLKEHDQFKLWHNLQVLREKNIPVASHADPLEGGWELDKFKNINIYRHAYNAFPDKKWYVLIDADTYLFWNNLLRYLETLDYNKEIYMGNVQLLGDMKFAHGGSGVIISQAAMAKTYGADLELEKKYDQNALDICCGDALMATVMGDFNITVETAFGGGLEPKSPANMWFWPDQWCKPLLTLHELRALEIFSVDEVEKHTTRDDPNKPVLHQDVGRSLVIPNLKPEGRDNWNNRAEGTEFNHTELITEAELQGLSQNEEVLEKKLREACKNKCEGSEDCLQWRLTKEKCFNGRFLSLGSPQTEKEVAEMKTFSGWLLDRIEKMFVQHECNRIFEY